MTEMRTLLESVRKYMEEQLYPFQTPAHKQGRWVDEKLLSFLGKAPFLADLSEPAGLDFAEALEAAQRRARDLAGAKASFFLWNGTTGGILAAVLASRPKQVVLSRSAHRSVFASLALAGAEPRYLYPRTLPGWEIFLPPDPQDYAAGLDTAEAVLLTHPSYWGLARNWQDLIFLAHSMDKLVLVDQAHGPHFRLSRKLPPSALEMGADLVVESTHKLGTAFTQASLLHLGTERIEQHSVAEALRLVQSTSPSFLLLLSLEAAVVKEEEGGAVWEKTLELARFARQKLEEQGWPVLSQADLPPGVLLDESRLVVRVRERGQSGIGAARFLKEEAKVVPEMADQHNVVLLLTPADDEASIGRLLEGFGRLIQEGKREAAVSPPPFPELALSPRQALLGPKGLVPLAEAAGEVAGNLVVPYPPGIPLLAPGDAIGKEHVEYLTWIKKLGWQVDGLTSSGEILIYQGG